MKGRSTRILLISILVLGAFIWIQEAWRAKVPSREYQRTKLFDLDIETLVALEFQYTNLVVECVKENGVWMTGGSGLGLGRADVALVHRLVAGLNSLGKGTTITAEHLEMRGFDAAEYGLARPSMRIRAADNRGRHSWLVGFKAALGNMVYVKEGDGEDIYTVHDVLLEMVPTKVDQLRDRVVFPGEIPGIRRLEIRGPGGFVQLLKDTKGGWQIQQPLSAPADSVVVEAFLETLHGLHIEDFVADNVSDFSVYGLQGETRQISLGGVEDASRMLVLGDELPDRPGFVYARRADDTSVFAMERDVLELLSFKLDDFRDRRVLPFPAARISSVSIAHGSEQLDLLFSEAGRWEIAQPVSWDADIYAIVALLQLWESAVVVEFDDAETDELAEWTFTFGSVGLGETNVLQILPAQGRRDGLRIRRDGESTVCQINLPTIPDSIVDPLHYKDRLVWRLDADEVQKLSLAGTEGERQVVERRMDGLFASAGGANDGIQVDAAAMEKVLENLQNMFAVGYVAYNPRNLSDYGLDRPTWSLHVGLAATNQIGRVLLIGKETEEGHYAMVQGRDVVFLLDKAVVGNLSMNLLLAPEPLLSDPE